jgi:hypothetical protein
MGPNGSITVASPPSPRAASAPGDYVVDDSITEYIDPMEFFNLHIPLVHGENDVDVTKFMYNSDNAFIDHEDMFLNHVDLNSEPGTTSFVTYGFRNIPEGENITRVEIWGEGYFGTSASNGLYIGIGDPELDTYKWVGPLKIGDEWALNCPFMDNTNDHQRAYLTLMVANGDDAEIREMIVFVNGMPLIGEQDLIPEQLLDPFPGPLPDDWLGPEGLGPEGLSPEL